MSEVGFFYIKDPFIVFRLWVTDLHDLKHRAFQIITESLSDFIAWADVHVLCLSCRLEGSCLLTELVQQIVIKGWLFIFRWAAYDAAGHRWLPGEFIPTYDASGACGSSTMREGPECLGSFQQPYVESCASQPSIGLDAWSLYNPQVIYDAVLVCDS
jgi:hypothetical protein